MLSGIASYFFGASEETEDQQQQQQQQQEKQPLEPRLQTRYADDNCDWIIVEQSSKSREGSPDRGTPISPDGTNPLVPASPPSHHDSSDSSSDISTLPDMACSGESWLVTPPPCFTAGGRSEERVEASPMENLLIEHPSMSVYGPRGRNSSTGVESDMSESSNDNDTAAGPDRTPQTRAVHRCAPPRRPRAVAQRAGLIAHVQSVKAVQRATQQKERRQMTRNHLQRSNRVHETQSRNKHQRRKDFMLRPSGRSNDRTC